MGFSVTPLLMDGDSVPPGVRNALRAASEVPAPERTPHLESAARILHREVGLDCRDARELVGLPNVGGCC